MGLPALDAEKYVERDNWLGVALAALMSVNKERKIELAGRALERIVNSAENPYRKTLLYDCVNTYLPVDEEEWRRFDEMIRNHPDSGVKAMQLSVYDYVERRGKLEGLEEGKLEGKLEGQRELVRKQLESRFGPLPLAVGAELEAMTGGRLTELGCDLLNASSLAELGLGDPQNGD